MLGNTEAMAIMGLMGSVTGAMGSFMQGSEQSKAYQYNANIAIANAQQTRQAEALHEEQMRNQETSTIGRQKAEYAGRGVQANTGSPIDMMVTTMANYNLDIAISGYNAEVAARGYESMAQMDIYEGKMAKKSAEVKGGMQLLSAGVSAGLLLAAL